jgi:UDP:flavonoid glycosyltransferase YjiC (YdhE family)
MRVLAACSVWKGGTGHFLPLVPFLDQVRRDEGQTLVVGHSSAEAMVRATGHPFLAGGEPPKPEGEKLLGPPAAAWLEVMGRTVRDWRPDVILREPFDYASAEAAARLGVPAAQVAFGLAGFMWEMIDRIAPKLEAFRDGLAGELHRSPFLTRLPASLDASPFPDTRRYREPVAAPHGALPAWWPGSGAPLVYVSFGTVMGGRPLSGEVYRAVIDAVAGLDARVLVTVGRDFDISRLRDVPGNVHVEAWVDQADVLAGAGLMVCHGGSGTTYGALAAGVPLVVMPMFADQFSNAKAIAKAGVGVQVLADQDARGRRRAISREDAPRIRQAIETVLADGSYRQAAQAVAAEMAAAPAIETLLGQLPQCR